MKAIYELRGIGNKLEIFLLGKEFCVSREFRRKIVMFLDWKRSGILRNSFETAAIFQA